MDWYRSVYNDDFCAQHSALVHEVGHNIGLTHSNEDGLYKDQTCLLGFSYRWTGGPRMCFNAHKNNFLGWYEDRTLYVNPEIYSWSGSIAAFVDYDKTSSNEYVLVSFGNIFMQYNRAKGINEQVMEKANRLVIVEKGEDASENLAGLKAGQTFQHDGTTVEFCYEYSEGDKDLIRVSIYRTGETSGCSDTDWDTDIDRAPLASVEAFSCFSGEMTVTVKGKGDIFMKDLELGDKVLTSSQPQKFETVYSFGHNSASEQGRYLQILPSKLELTHDHMIFIHGERQAVPASSLKVGDQLANGEVITAIRKVNRRGAYAPFTTSGDLLVNGILVSSYVAFQGKDRLTVGPVQLSYQWLAHTFTFPHRFICTRISTCATENYTKAGLSFWVDFPHQVMRWWLSSSQNSVILTFVGNLCILSFISIMAVLEFLLESKFALTVSIMALFAYKTYSSARDNHRREKLKFTTRR